MNNALLVLGVILIVSAFVFHSVLMWAGFSAILP